jgi:ABC-type nitrate/sulfonate/bicarbonate transport system ATPase subunit
VQIVEKRKKQSFLFVTHDIEEVLHLADRVLVMSNRAAPFRKSSMSIFHVGAISIHLVTWENATASSA